MLPAGTSRPPSALAASSLNVPRNPLGLILQQAPRPRVVQLSRCEQQPAQPRYRTHAASAGQQHSNCQQASTPEQAFSLAHDASGGSNHPPDFRKRTAENDDDHSNSSTACLWPIQLLFCALLPAIQLLHAPAAAAASKAKTVKRDDVLLDSGEIDAFVERIWELSGPILHNMGFSGLLGAAAAAALKAVGRLLAASVGICLILIQVLAYNDIITVKWSVVHEQVRQVLDTTGTGRLDSDKFKRQVKKGLVILSEVSRSKV
eukprot:GHUV01020040.1.p1 GENE.GHUV01020040.1~~GHUV01020040.1.p1  ORF type:complete len:261 (+),score=51.68 GHUV01020040.1:266-1048(+)